MRLPEPRFRHPETLSRLRAICGEAYVSTRESDRIATCRDMWPRTLIRQRAGAFDHPPDVVVWPADSGEVARVIVLAREVGLPVVPFGAGSGVCGGTLPIQGGIILDLKRQDRILDLSETDRLLTVESGIIGENLERELNGRGFTLGHFPSSIGCSTVGGWIAARGAGQCSSRYGKIEDLVRALRYVDAAGRLCSTPLSIGAGEGWRLDPLLLGSEGTLGVVTAATLAIRPLCRERWLRGYRFPRMRAGLEAMRRLLRAGIRPAVLRLYDEFDTLIAKSDPTTDEAEDSLLGGVRERLTGSMTGLALHSLPRLLQFPALLNRATAWLPTGCLLVLAIEAEPEERALSAELSAETCHDQGGEDLGEGPARHWYANRYAVAYKQAPLFVAGAFVDTLEVATTWDRLLPLYAAVRQAVASRAFVMAHFSHAYREGCSIYFTFAAAGRDDAAALVLYDQIWDAALEVVLAQGAALSHHHGVGLAKQRFLLRQLADARLLHDAVKATFDPTGLLNPGKLGQGGGRR